jgi:hypothetical protein
MLGIACTSRENELAGLELSKKIDMVWKGTGKSYKLPQLSTYGDISATACRAIDQSTGKRERVLSGLDWSAIKNREVEFDCTEQIERNIS